MMSANPCDRSNAHQNQIAVSNLAAAPDAASGLMPRPERRPRRARVDRGLPPDDELRRLAESYLIRQRELWPKLDATEHLPEPTPKALDAMVEQFKHRHRGGAIERSQISALLSMHAILAAAYCRYSCDNSSPTSIIDQLRNILDKAHAEARFIPWEYVYADYSVTGLDAGRQGYQSYKAALRDKAQAIETTYIDDFTRASRDELEWWKLAALSKSVGKRLIGASDGFDLSSADWDIKITLYGLIARLFVRSLREKCRRGMRGAARRGTCLGKLPLGFTRRPAIDDAGNLVTGPDGLPIYDICIDPTSAAFRLQMFEWYVERRWSLGRIAREFNRLKVDGWDRWSKQAIRDLLLSGTAIGVFIWDQTRREYDYETEKYVAVRNPRKDWIVRYERGLAIVPVHLYAAARRMLAATKRRHPLNGRTASRNQIAPTTLLSGTLYCEYCGAELKLIRSTTQYKQIGCWNGLNRAAGCQLLSSKSTRVVETCIVKYLSSVLLGPTQIEEILKLANQHIDRWAAAPQADAAPLKREAEKLKTKIDRLVRKVEDADDPVVSDGYDRRIKQLQIERNALVAQIAAANAQQRRPLTAMSMEDVLPRLVQLRESLSKDGMAAAHVIRDLTGPIRIRQEANDRNKHGARWIATFSPQWMAVLRYLFAHDGSSASRIEVPIAPVEVKIDKVPQYESLAQTAKRMRERGASKQTISSALKVNCSLVNDALEFAATGNRPVFKSIKRTHPPVKRVPLYVQHAQDVVDLRDESVSFKDIATQLGIAENTASRASTLR